MSTSTPPSTRDAWNTIRGYVYQVDLTIQRWLDLQPGQILELERGEDIDIVALVSYSPTAIPEERSRLSEQVKHRNNSSITLGASEAVTAIAHFIENRQTNPGLRFLYTTNASVGREQKSPMPKEIKAINAWEQIRQGSLQGTEQNEAVQGIRTILLEKVEKPSKLNEGTWKIFRNFITNPNNDELLDLIRSFEWNTKAPDAQSLSAILERLLIERQHATDTIQAQEQYQKVFVYVFKRLCKREIKRLTVEERERLLSQPTLSETDHQLLNNVVVWVQALEVRVQEHEVRLGVLEQHLDRERSKPYGGQDVAGRVKELLQDYNTKLFVGREDALSQLDEFVTQTDKKYLTITAPAGFGKTALLANWVAMRQDKGYFIAYHFFQRDDITRSVSNAYRNLLRQLHDYYELSDKSLPINEDELRDKLCYLLENYEVREDKPLIMVVDGLDEATPERSLSLFLPQPLPEGLYVIVSVRANETEKLDDPPTQVTQELHLEALLSPTIADWLRRAGNGELLTLAQDAIFMAQVCDRTEGRPLFLKCLIDELVEVAQQGEESAIRKTLAATPKGFADYIRQQYQALDQLEDWRSRPDLRKIFYFLTIAKGELSSDDLVELMGESPVGLPWRVSRWFKIRQLEDCLVFSFAHSTLAEQFAILPEIKANTKKSQKELIKYCAEWQEHHSPYALRHYAEHLRDVEEWEKLYAIARNEDFAVAQREQLPDEPDLSLKTVQTALLGATDTDDAGAMAEFMLVHARRLVQTTVQESPLDALRAGNLERAWKLADMCEIERFVLWYLLLVWELKDKGKLEEAKKTLERLLIKKLPRFTIHATTRWQGDFAVQLLACVFNVNEAACTTLIQQLFENYHHRLLCKIFVDRGEFDAALETTQGISSEFERVLELQEIAKAQVEKGKRNAARTTFNQAIEIIRKPAPNPFWVHEMGRIAKAQIEKLEDTEVGRDTFAYALETAWKIRNQQDRVNAFIAIANMQADVKEFADALITLQRINVQHDLEDCLKVGVLTAWATLEAKAGKTDKAQITFTSAKEVARSIEDKNKQRDALVKIARTQAEVREFINNAYRTAEEINNQLDKAKALQEIVKVQVQSEDFSAALATANGIEEPISKVQALIGIAQAQAKAKPFTDDALKTVESINDPVWRTQVLATIAKEQAKAGNFPGALATKNRIENQTEQQNVLLTIAYAYAKAKNFTVALKIAEEIDGLTQIETLGFIARALTEDEQAQPARSTLAAALQSKQGVEPAFLQVLVLANIAKIQEKYEQEIGVNIVRISHQIVQRIAYPTERTIAMALIAEVLAKSGQEKEAEATFDKANETAQEIKIQQERVSSFTAIAEAQARIEDFSAALKTVQKIEWPNCQAKVLATIAQEQVKAGQDKEAHQTVNAAFEIAQDYYSIWGSIGVLCTVTVAQATVGQQEEALKLLTELYEAVQKNRKRDKDLSTIATAQVKVGEITTALKITDEIEDESERVKALSWIAWTQFKQGEKGGLLTTLAAALEAKDKIEDEQKQVEALRAIAGIQAMAGKGEEAVRTVEAILTARNLHLPRIASWFVETDDKENFKQLLILCAYYLDAAYEMCGHLAQLYPEKVEEIAKVVSEFN